MTVPTTRRLRPSMVVALALLLSACGTTNTNLVTGESQRGAFTWAQEIELGRETDQQITAQFGLYDDAALTAYVRRLGEDVLATSAYTDPNTPAEIRNTPFTFRVLDADLVNAFAVPGGYVYVTRGLMAFLENEAQLAVVLGHEIGHVLGRHSSQRAQRAQLGQFGLIGAAIGSAVLGAGSGVTQGILDYGGTGLQLLQLSYSREAEREADLAGVAYAEFAGYDASEAARFFRTLNRLSDGNAPPTFLSTHPNPEEREQNILALANSDPRYQGTVVNTGPYLAQIEGIVLGQDPRQGFVEDGVFWHPELRFRLDVPRGWRTQNSPAAFQMAEPNGQAVVQLTLAQGSSAEGAARALASQQGVQVSGSGAVTVGGNRAYRVEGTAPQQNGSLGFSATFVEYGGNVYQLLGITAANSLSQYASTFRSAADTFDRLTDSRYLNRRPTRLEVVTTSGRTTLQALLRGRTIPPGMSEEQIAIMNQVRLGDTIPSGSRVKLPE